MQPKFQHKIQPKFRLNFVLKFWLNFFLKLQCMQNNFLALFCRFYGNTIYISKQNFLLELSFLQHPNFLLQIQLFVNPKYQVFHLGGKSCWLASTRSQSCQHVFEAKDILLAQKWVSLKKEKRKEERQAGPELGQAQPLLGLEAGV